MKRTILAGAVAVVFGTLLAVPSAEAFTSPPVWTCRATAERLTVNGGPAVEAAVANGLPGRLDRPGTENAQCATAETGAGNLLQPLGIPGTSIGLSTASAITTITPELGKAIDQKVTAFGQVEGANIGGLEVLGVASAGATGSCIPGNLTPQLTGTSNGATLLGGNLDGVLAGLSTALKNLGLAPVLDVTPNEQVTTADSLTQRALHVKILQGAGGAPLVDLILGEAKVDFNGPVCDPNQQGGPQDFGRPCPVGSVFVPSTNLCVIPPGTVPPGFAACTSKFGTIVVGVPFKGPSGGVVLALDCARRFLGNKVCLRGNSDPKFAIVGTNKRDKITGTNKADRILSRGGNDSVSGGRGNDCIQGGTGNDKVSGDIGADRVFGESGRDALNGSSGNDRLSGGTGNDSINAGFGRDRVTGGSGNDSITIATAGPRATVDCGSGRDKVRVNFVERNSTRNCELKYVFKDRPGVDNVRSR
jgi:Ca2+-binding RTX toxin-like protein